jgi:hypothetical protein
MTVDWTTETSLATSRRHGAVGPSRSNQDGIGWTVTVAPQPARETFVSKAAPNLAEEVTHGNQGLESPAIARGESEVAVDLSASETRIELLPWRIHQRSACPAYYKGALDGLRPLLRNNSK